MRLLRGCREQETRYLVRTLIQHMRIGMNTTLVLGALAAAYVLEKRCHQCDVVDSGATQVSAASGIGSSGEMRLRDKTLDC